MRSFNQPVIGITMSIDDYDMIKPGIDYNYIRREYGAMVRHAGGQPIFIDPTIDPEVVVELCDGVVISGGEDIEPEMYDEPDRAFKQKEPQVRTNWERLLIDACDVGGVPIFGVCYGAQLLNVHFGGTLYQDIIEDKATTLSHGIATAPVLHEVRFIGDYMGFRDGERIEVNSRHHQAIRRLAPGFSAVGFSPDGIVEAIVGGSHTGVQWHPESDETGERLYQGFIERCREGALSRLEESAYNAAYERALQGSA